MPDQRQTSPPRETEPDGGFPPGIANPARRVLAAAGYDRLDPLAAAREADLLALHGMGPKALGLLRRSLALRGMSFAGAERTDA